MKAANMRSSLKGLILSVAIAAALVAALFYSTALRSVGTAEASGAHLVAHYYNADNGSEVLIYREDDGYMWWLFKMDQDSDWELIDVGYNGNPNPEDGSGDPPNMDAILDLAKQHGSPVTMVVDFGGTELGLLLGEHGKTIDPYYNPATMTNEFDGLGGGIDPNGGSATEQLKKAARSGDSDDDDDATDPTNGDGLFGDLPGPPELVNPAPVAR